MTFIIKQDIANINKQIAALQSYVKQHNSHGRAKQVDEHNNNVVMLLQSKLANTSMTFKDVLEIRTQVRTTIQPSFLDLSDECSTQNMKESKDRTEQFMYSASTSASSTSGSSAYRIPLRLSP